MKHTLKFIINFLLLVSATAFSQTVTNVDSLPKTTVVKDTAVPVYPQRYGLRVGVDLYRLARSFYEDGYKGIELVGDYRLKKKLYAAAELGTLDYTIDEPQLNYTTKGSYLKIGVDYNTYENWLDMENMIYVGGRYGFSSFSQTLNTYTVYQNSNIDGTGNYLTDVTINADREYKALSAHWVEFVAGLKAELFNNVFLGFSLRLNYLITDKKPTDFDNLYIPGFNRTYDGKFGVGLNYTISYFIPLYKKQPVKPETN
ncbi:DUF6048 family protein [Flavobacterium rhizosphaerae]|uniref:DUF6048 family protein n=1 Tax=Flavobacterium rhizosphaerae TaxID=3163298 RepID=A0ABW8YTW2_9FLAO